MQDLMNQFVEFTEKNSTNNESVSFQIFSEETLFTTLVNLLQSNDTQKIIELISVKYRGILNIVYNEDGIYDRAISHNMKLLFLNTQFISCFRRAIEGVQYSDSDILCVNKIGYDLLNSNIKIENDVVKEVANLCSLINTDKARLLSRTTCLQPEVIDVLLLARYSHIDPDIYVRRLNLALMTEGVVDEQEIICVYETICNQFKSLFITTMIDVYTQEELNSIGDYADEVYSTIGLAVVDILNSFNTTDIREVLLEYAYIISTPEVKQKGVIFTLDSLSPDDFGLVLGVANSLKLEGYYM